MLSFKQFILESSRAALAMGRQGLIPFARQNKKTFDTIKLLEPNETLLLSDMDDTLVKFPDPHTVARVHVKNERGERISTTGLTPTQYNSHELKDGHSYDYADFLNPHIFKKSAHPIHETIRTMNHVLDNGGHAHIVTARSDMKDHPILLGALKQMGLNVDHPNFHLHRAGNFGRGPTHENKAKMIDKILTPNEKGKYPYGDMRPVKNVVVIDDHRPNVGKEMHSNLSNTSTEGRRFVGIHFNPETKSANIVHDQGTQ